MSAKTLVIVPGHGVCIEPAFPAREESWVGIFPKEAELLFEQIRFSVAVAWAMNAFLVFSGGRTRKGTTLGEGETYRNVAVRHSWFGFPSVGGHCGEDHHARDSLGNVVFALGLYRQTLGAYPDRIYCCGYGFKSERFRFHAASIGWSRDFAYLSVNEPHPSIRVASKQGEENKFGSMRDDPYLRGKQWVEQRNARNPLDEPVPFVWDDLEFAMLTKFLYASEAKAIPSWTK